jgi:hypothetical protein
MPEDAGIGATPQSPAQPASDRMRLMLSPATMSSSAAVSGPMLLGVDRGAFTRGLDLDIDAAIAAITLPFHNGRTEGVNTKGILAALSALE